MIGRPEEIRWRTAGTRRWLPLRLLAHGGYAATAAAPAAGARRARGDGCRSGCWRTAGTRRWLPLRPLARGRTGSARKRVSMGLRLGLVLALLMVPAVLRAGDTSALRPPKGARVALIAFEDLQCPDCADAEALLEEASAKYGIPLVRRDFPLPMHDWSFEAHVLARYFDTQTDTQTGTKTGTQTGTKSDAKAAANALPPGEQFRRWVYSNQSSINKGNLRGMAERFADQHHLELPANYDPKGELKKLVLADFALGQQVGVLHTPTVYVVSVSQRGAPFVEGVERDKLFTMIEQMQAAEKR